MTRKDRNENSYRRALKIALIVSVVAHGLVLAFGQLEITNWLDEDEGPSFVMLPVEELPADRPLELIELADEADGAEAAEESSSAAISEAVASESSEPTGELTEPIEAESAAPRVVFTNPESSRASAVFLTAVSTDASGPTLATDATIEDLLVKKPPETADGTGEDEEQWASGPTSRRRGGGIGIGIGVGGFGGGDTCGPGDRFITARVPLGAGRFQPRF